jgi:hypothetical protein
MPPMMRKEAFFTAVACGDYEDVMTILEAGGERIAASRTPVFFLTPTISLRILRRIEE